MMVERITSALLAAVIGGLGAAGCDPEILPATATNPTSVAVASAARELENGGDRAGADDRDGDGDDDGRDQRLRVSQLKSLLEELRAVRALEPLFAQYGVPAPIVYDAGARGLVALLQAVRISFSFGVLTITNRANHGIIYAAPVIDLASGTLQPQHLPPPAG
jgi:hypothetical protein